MKPYVLSILFALASCTIIAGESSDDSYDPSNENSSSQDSLEYNEYSKKRDGDFVFDKNKKIKNRSGAHQHVIESNVNFLNFNNISEANIFQYQSLDSLNVDIDSPNNESTSVHISRNPLNFSPFITIESDPLFNDNYEITNKKISFKLMVFKALKTMEPSSTMNSEEISRLNKNFLERFKKENPYLTSLDLFFETLHKENPTILYADIVNKVLEIKKSFYD